MAMLGALLIVAAAGPEIAELKTFRDWIVGCDNGLLCQAAAMMPNSAEPAATLSVRRGPEGSAVPEVWFYTWEGEAADIVVDGKPLRLRLRKNEEGAYVVDAADAVRLLDALRAASAVEVVDSAGKSSGMLSVDGATAALLYIDDQQHRLGTRGALVRRGDKPDSSVPAPPDLPVRYTVPGSSKPPAQLSAAFVANVLKEAGCEEENDPNVVSHDRLDDRHTLAMVTLRCESGAYNYISQNFVIPDGGAPEPAKFDDEGEGQEGDTLYYNLSWNAQSRRLDAGFLGRGIGDCGSRQHYVWDGAMFRLVGVEEMDDCRGVSDFISVWRARVVER
ncbi:MAG: DUF1176 domain-containing protein [Alphaproteobacteria bacterium]